MTFREQVYRKVSEIPEGKVATYGQIARLIDHPRSARQVGFALRALGLNEENIPWWRVINSRGEITINHGDGGIEKEIQSQLLEKEGIVVSNKKTVELIVNLWETT